MSLNETNHALEFLLSEEPGMRSREAGTLNSGQDCIAGTVLGELLTIGSATFVGTVGTRGTVTVASTVGPQTQIGTYVLKCTAASSNAGTFQLRAPNGSLVVFDTSTTITVGGGAYTSDHLGITIADGATDFSVGDTYTIEVSGGDYEILDPTEDDGAQIAAAILCSSCDASSGDQGIAVIARAAEVSSAKLTWPDGITDAQKATATAQLAARGIILR